MSSYSENTLSLNNQSSKNTISKIGICLINNWLFLYEKEGQGVFVLFELKTKLLKIMSKILCLKGYSAVFSIAFLFF